MFLLLCIVIVWYVIKMLIFWYYVIEIKNYLFVCVNFEDGGWGLYIEGEILVFGILFNYIVLWIVGVDVDYLVMVKVCVILYKMGGVIYVFYWVKWWLVVMGVVQWDIVNLIFFELWFFLDWVFIVFWRWWIYIC